MLLQALLVTTIVGRDLRLERERNRWGMCSKTKRSSWVPLTLLFDVTSYKRVYKRIEPGNSLTSYGSPTSKLTINGGRLLGMQSAPMGLEKRDSCVGSQTQPDLKLLNHTKDFHYRYCVQPMLFYRREKRKQYARRNNLKKEKYLPRACAPGNSSSSRVCVSSLRKYRRIDLSDRKRRKGYDLVTTPAMRNQEVE
ncbi:hypothetical protein M0804_007706 [Polistes exclamans]|nr:hypothetical protein M0804_007706 [Polistes exclamans]